MITLTAEGLKQWLVKYHKVQEGSIILGLLLIAFLIGALQGIGVVLVILIFCTKKGWTLRMTRKTEQKAPEFFLKEKPVVSKWEKENGAGKEYYLAFEQLPETPLRDKDLELLGQNISCEEIYEETLPGDSFFLVFLQDQKEPVCVIPVSCCQLAAGDFTQQEGCYYPAGLKAE